jgi:glycerol-3-phosphate acyltransferase PlsY
MIVAVVLVCYLIGSLPIAWIVTRLVTGEDLRELSTGNVGVMNVGVSVTRWAMLLVFLGEAGKGVAAVLFARSLGGGDILIGSAAVAAVVGTRWSIWLRGAGGRGFTAGAAAAGLIAWPAVLIELGAWLLVRLVTGSTFWAARLTIGLFPVVAGLVTGSWWYAFFGLLLSVIYLSTHLEETDDHLVIKQRWPGLWAFLTGPRRG